MAIRHTEFFDILRDYEPITTLESITVYGSGASTFKLPRGDLEIEVKSTYIRVRARGGRKILRIIKDLKSVEHVKELFSDAVKNLGKDWIVIEILGELRRAESGEENYAIGTIRELYAFLKKRLILPWKEKPKGRIVIKYTFSRRPGFDFLKYEEGEIIVVEVKGGRPEALDRLMNEANKRVARKFKDLKDMLKNLGLKELKIRLERVGEVELVVEGEKGKILLRVKGYVYKIVGSPFKEGAEAHGFEEGRYLISLEKLPEGREIKVNLDKAYLEAVLEYLREGKIEIKTVEFKPKVEKRGKLVWEENVISVFPIQL